MRALSGHPTSLVVQVEDFSCPMAAKRGFAECCICWVRDCFGPDWHDIFPDWNLALMIGICLGMDSTDGKYHFYWSGPFSQWQRSEFEIDDRRFATAEQAMMYFKAILFSDKETAEQIMAAVDPGQQKALGRRVKNFSEAVWNENKYQIVYQINLQKFKQNKGLRRKLFQTGERKLVEASPVDTIWGIGLEASVANVTPEADWPGQNLLGEILTKVRSDLRVTFPDEAVQVSSTT